MYTNIPIYTHITVYSTNMYNTNIILSLISTIVLMNQHKKAMSTKNKQLVLL